MATQSRRLCKLNQIDNSKETWKVNVRVLRLYPVPSFMNPLETSRVEMVFLDDKNNKIQAMFKDKVIKTFRPLLHEGEVYTISNFTVLENNDKLKSTFMLMFHSPNEQRVVFGEEYEIEFVKNSQSDMFLAWMDLNSDVANARLLTYSEIPTKYVWDMVTNKWHRRMRGSVIGEICNIPPTDDEKYYLRMLLYHVRGPRSYEEIRTVKGVLYDTFKQAFHALGLLDDDH